MVLIAGNVTALGRSSVKSVNEALRPALHLRARNELKSRILGTRDDATYQGPAWLSRRDLRIC